MSDAGNPKPVMKGRIRLTRTLIYEGDAIEIFKTLDLNFMQAGVPFRNPHYTITEVGQIFEPIEPTEPVVIQESEPKK